jgi:hypothetical protein
MSNHPAHGITGSFVNRIPGAMALAVLVCAQVMPGQQAPPFSINPMRVETEVVPGVEKTVAFEIEAGKGNEGDRGRLVLSLTDWTLHSDGSVAYVPVGSTKNSASSWISYSPGALTVEAGRHQVVRVTINAPANTKPGVYSSGIFVQERPPATPFAFDRQVLNVRIRYVFTLYVIVGPVAPNPNLISADFEPLATGLKMTCEMENTGSRHVRPVIYWSLHSDVQPQDLTGRIDATVLLPAATLREPYTLSRAPLPAGRYDATLMVDFQDGQPRQAMNRSFEVGPKPSVSTSVDYPMTIDPDLPDQPGQK